MSIHTKAVDIDTSGGFAVKNITALVKDFVRSTGVHQGAVTVFYQHTTGAVVIAEHEAGIIVDLEDTIEDIVPTHRDYKHHLRGVDVNGHAHVRSALMSVSVTVPIAGGKLLLGTYQDILLIDMQTENKMRQFVIQVTGE